MRACPVCTDKPMEVLPLRTVEYDRCPACGGMWFEAGELAAVLPPASLARMLAAARDEKARCRSCAGDVVNGACATCSGQHLKCPGCGRRDLVNLIVGGAEIEVCNPCGGFWLDAGELEQVGEAEGRPVKESRGIIRGLPHAGAAAAAMLAASAAVPPATQSSASSTLVDGVGTVIEGVGAVLDAADVVDILVGIFSALTD